MTGMELFEGLSFVDERFIQEAETAKLGRNTPWLKVLSVAACLCILMVGAFAMGEFGSKGATEAITEEAAAPTEAAQGMPAADAAVEGAPPAPAEMYPETEAGEEKLPTDELHHISTVTLRIVSVEDDRWVAVVEEVSDEPTALEVGMQVTVVIDAGEVPENGKEATSRYGGILLPEEGLLARVEDGAYDAGANILYITGAKLEEPTD